MSPDIARDRIRSSDERLFIAEVEGKAAGPAAVATAQLVTRPSAVARLTALVVAQEHRRQGGARQLVEAVLRFAASDGCEGLELTTAIGPAREAAHRFYVANGFTRTSYRYWRNVRPSPPNPTAAAR